MRAWLATLVQVALVVALMAAAVSEVWTQQRAGGPAPIGVPRAPLGAGPWVLDTAEQHKIKVSIVAGGLVNPWSMAWLPNGDVLITERPGRLRLLHKDGALDPTPISGVPTVKAQRLSGLMDVVLHPRFAENHFVYLTYNKGRATDGMMATVLARGRLDGMALTDVKDLFVAEPWWDGAGGSASRLAFGRDGMLYVTTAGNGAQDPNSQGGKVLRLKDDGTVPPDNPFVGKPGYRPEVYTLGHRSSLGLALNPATGDMWLNENGPNGGDEINVLKPGANYGWPTVSYGRSYPGPWQNERPGHAGFEPPIVYWMPSIAVSGMAFYTGDRFPKWKGDVFVGGMRTGEIPGTGHLERILFNEKMEELRRESLLTDLHQRIRDVKQGPDGYLYVATDEEKGAILRLATQ